MDGSVGGSRNQHPGMERLARSRARLLLAAKHELAPAPGESLGGNQNVTLARADLDVFQPAGMSLMPEGLLDNFSEEQTRDLFAYLRSTQPLVGKPPRPASNP